MWEFVRMINDFENRINVYIRVSVSRKDSENARGRVERFVRESSRRKKVLRVIVILRMFMHLWKILRCKNAHKKYMLTDETSHCLGFIFLIVFICSHCYYYVGAYFLIISFKRSRFYNQIRLYITKEKDDK